MDRMGANGTGSERAGRQPAGREAASREAAGINIRELRAADHAAIRAMASELTAGMPTWRPAEDQVRAVSEWVKQALTDDHQAPKAVFVAVRPRADGGASVLGFVSVTERRHFTGQRQAYVGELVVQPPDRRTGVATALMAAAEDWAGRRDLAAVTLETGAGNPAARELYGRLGYVEEDVTLTKRLRTVS